jgi:hypothetical protein
MDGETQPCRLFYVEPKGIVEYVTNDDSQVSFSSYARTYIEKIDKPRTAKNYILALKHLEKYMGTC